MRILSFASHSRSLISQLPSSLLIASAVGWALLTSYDMMTPLSALCLSITRIDRVISAQFAAAYIFAEPSALAVSWLTMLLAMMPPLLANALSHVWHRNPRKFSPRAITLFVAGYVTVWLLVGALLGAVVLMLASVALLSGLSSFALATTVALFWQITPIKQYGLNRCHSKPPLPIFGLRAAFAWLRYGFAHGLWCAGSCWALMLLPLVADGPLHWPVMAAVSIVLVLERYRPPRLVRWGSALPRWLLPARNRPTLA